MFTIVLKLLFDLTMLSICFRAWRRWYRVPARQPIAWMSFAGGLLFLIGGALDWVEFMKRLLQT